MFELFILWFTSEGVRLQIVAGRESLVSTGKIFNSTLQLVIVTELKAEGDYKDQCLPQNLFN